MGPINRPPTHRLGLSIASTKIFQVLAIIKTRHCIQAAKTYYILFHNAPMDCLLLALRTVGAALHLDEKHLAHHLKRHIKL